MKKKNYTLLLMFMLAGMLLFSAGCKKKGCTDSTADNYSASAEKDDGSCSYTKGALKVIAVDGTGDPLAGHEIWIYDNETDFTNGTNPVQTKTADGSGAALFTNLHSGEFWADCEYTNLIGVTTFAEGHGNVSAGKQTTITIQP